MTIKTPSCRLVTSLFFVLASLGLSRGQTTWDFGANPDQNWSTFGNWSTDADPAATAVVFGNTGTAANATTVGNVVDQNFAIDSLTYSGSGAGWQVTRIAAGSTLTIDASTAPAFSLRVGGYAAGDDNTSFTTRAAITGPGSLVVNEPTAAIAIGNSGGNNTGGATLDLSALASFQATVGNFTVAGGINNGYGTLYLSDSTVITSGTFSTGGSGAYNNRSHISNRLYLGDSTRLNADTVALASGRTPGLVQFRPAASGANPAAASNAVLTIRGTAGGTSRASMTIGDLGGGTSGQNGSSHVDLTGGAVDAMVSTLTIGRSPASLSGNYSASLSVSSGTFDATSVVVGETINNNTGAGSLTGNLNVSGGNFIAGSLTLANNAGGGTRATNGNLNVSGSANVHVAGNLVMGNRTGAVVTPTVNISAGTLLIDGSLAEGTGAGANIVSTVNLSGGVLDMTQGAVAVDTFTITGGTLKNVSSFAAGATGGLALQNATLGFDNINSASANSLVLTGAFSLTGTTDLSLSLADGFNPGAGNILLVDNDLGDLISGTFATVNGMAGGTFTLTNDQGSFQYQLSYTGGDGNDLVAISVPEPSAGLLLGLGMAGLLGSRRRRCGNF